MVSMLVHYFIAEGTVELRLMNRDAEPTLDHGPVQEWVHIGFEGFSWYSVQPRTRSTGSSMIQMCLKPFIIGVVLTDQFQSVAIYGM